MCLAFDLTIPLLRIHSGYMIVYMHKQMLGECLLQQLYIREKLNPPKCSLMRK